MSTCSLAIKNTDVVTDVKKTSVAVTNSEDVYAYARKVKYNLLINQSKCRHVRNYFLDFAYMNVCDNSSVNYRTTERLRT